MDIDWDKIHKLIPEKILLFFHIATFEVSYPRAPGDFAIKILQQPNKQYLGLPNYDYWGPDQATPYKSVNPEDSIEDALASAISGITLFDKADFPNDCIFWVKYRGFEPILVMDGNGSEVTWRDANNRRDKYHQEKNTVV